MILRCVAVLALLSGAASAQVWNGSSYFDGTSKVTFEVRVSATNPHVVEVRATKNGVSSSWVEGVPASGVGPGNQIGAKKSDDMSVGSRTYKVANGRAFKETNQAGTYIGLRAVKQEKGNGGKTKITTGEYHGRGPGGDDTETVPHAVL